jgi:hypothetical protein
MAGAWRRPSAGTRQSTFRPLCRLTRAARPSAAERTSNGQSRAYSPELNPVERVWEYLRDRWLSHRVLAGGYQAVVDAACAAWNALLAEPGRLRSLTSFPWLPPAVSTS